MQPDITKAQILAILTWAAAQAVAFGWLSSPASQVTLSAAATVIAAAWKFADAHIRGKRNEAKGLAALDLHDPPPAAS